MGTWRAPTVTWAKVLRHFCRKLSCKHLVVPLRHTTCGPGGARQLQGRRQRFQYTVRHPAVGTLGRTMLFSDFHFFQQYREDVGFRSILALKCSFLGAEFNWKQKMKQNNTLFRCLDFLNEDIIRAELGSPTGGAPLITNKRSCSSCNRIMALMLKYRPYSTHSCFMFYMFP